MQPIDWKVGAIALIIGITVVLVPGITIAHIFGDSSLGSSIKVALLVIISTTLANIGSGITKSIYSAFRKRQ